MSENIKEKIEDKVIDWIILGSGNRLIVFKPENSDKDLIVEKRSKYNKKTIFLNICAKNSDNCLELAKDLKPEDNVYFLFVDFDTVKQDIKDDCWMIPSLEMQITADKKDLSKFLVNKKHMSKFLIEKLEDSKYKK